MPQLNAQDSELHVAIRMADGGEFTAEQARNGISHAYLPSLVEAWVDDSVIDDVADNFLQMGDCCLDGMQAAYWLMKQRELLACPLVERISDAPAIICGSGPSLDAMLPAIKSLQDRAIIVCAHSTLNLLVRAGITPHVCCPSERVQYASQIYCDVPRETWYAGLPIVPHDYKKFQRHMLAMSSTPVFRWAGQMGPFGGSTSGIMAATVAHTLTSGKLYLCGYDMVSGHATHYAGREMGATTEALCADGVMRKTNQLYLRTRNELSFALGDAHVYQCAPQGLALDGKGSMAGCLPNPHILPIITFNPTGTGNRERVADFEAKIRSLRAEWPSIVERVKNVKTLEDCAAKAISSDEHEPLMSYILYSLYAQLSIERRLGRGDAIHDWFRIAAGNVLDCLTGYVMEATNV
jgi:hypothetical protein